VLCLSVFCPQLLVAVAEAEREVAEVRQLREEEDALLLAAVQAMAELWVQLQEVRRLQGGRHLTDVAFSVVQLPPSPGEEAPLQAVSATVDLRMSQGRSATMTAPSGRAAFNGLRVTRKRIPACAPCNSNDCLAAHAPLTCTQLWAALPEPNSGSHVSP
jgi:hypothetical protein